jgi:flagellar biosynthetic protein FliR
MAQVMDPTTGLNSPVMGRFFETLCFLFFLNVDGHHKIFELLGKSFDEIPVGDTWNLVAMREGLIHLVTRSIELSIRIASPVYATLLLITTTLIVLSRAVPQIHLMDFSYALRILFAMFGMLWFTGIMGPYIYEVFGTFFDGIGVLVVELGAL